MTRQGHRKVAHLLVVPEDQYGVEFDLFDDDSICPSIWAAGGSTAM